MKSYMLLLMIIVCIVGASDVDKQAHMRRRLEESGTRQCNQDDLAVLHDYGPPCDEITQANYVTKVCPCLLIVPAEDAEGYDCIAPNGKSVYENWQICTATTTTEEPTANPTEKPTTAEPTAGPTEKPTASPESFCDSFVDGCKENTSYLKTDAASIVCTDSVCNTEECCITCPKLKITPSRESAVITLTNSAAQAYKVKVKESTSCNTHLNNPSCTLQDLKDNEPYTPTVSLIQVVKVEGRPSGIQETATECEYDNFRTLCYPSIIKELSVETNGKNKDGANINLGHAEIKLILRTDPKKVTYKIVTTETNYKNKNNIEGTLDQTISAHQEVYFTVELTPGTKYTVTINVVNKNYCPGKVKVEASKIFTTEANKCLDQPVYGNKHTSAFDSYRHKLKTDLVPTLLTDNYQSTDNWNTPCPTYLFDKPCHDTPDHSWSGQEYNDKNEQCYKKAEWCCGGCLGRDSCFKNNMENKQHWKKNWCYETPKGRGFSNEGHQGLCLPNCELITNKEQCNKAERDMQGHDVPNSCEWVSSISPAACVPACWRLSWRGKEGKWNKSFKPNAADKHVYNCKLRVSKGGSQRFQKLNQIYEQMANNKRCIRNPDYTAADWNKAGFRRCKLNPAFGNGRRELAETEELVEDYDYDYESDESLEKDEIATDDKKVVWSEEFKVFLRWGESIVSDSRFFTLNLAAFGFWFALGYFCRKQADGRVA